MRTWDVHKPSVKRWISGAVFSLGILGGFCGCLIYPMASFTIGANDCWQEILGLSLVFLSMFPASIVALRFPLAAGSWMLLVAGFLPYALMAERSYMIHVRNFPDQGSLSQVFSQSFYLGWPYILLGAFAIVTSKLRWPTVLPRKTENEA